MQVVFSGSGMNGTIYDVKSMGKDQFSWCNPTKEGKFSRSVNKLSHVDFL
jgi:hypothetical protein